MTKTVLNEPAGAKFKLKSSIMLVVGLPANSKTYQLVKAMDIGQQEKIGSKFDKKIFLWHEWGPYTDERHGKNNLSAKNLGGGGCREPRFA